MRSFVGHDVDVNDVAFSPSGLLATTGDDGALRVWDPEDGRLISEVLGTGRVWGASFSPDSGRLSAAWLDESAVRVVEVRTGEILTVARVPGGPRSTSFSPDGRRVAVGTDDPAGAQVLDAASGDRLHTLSGHDGSVREVRFSPDGTWLATASEDGTVQIRDAGTAETVAVLSDSGPVAALAWAPDSQHLAAGGFDGAARVYAVGADRAELSVVVAGATTASGVVGLSFSPDGTRLLTGDDRLVAATVWDVGPDGDAEVANLPGEPDTWMWPAYTADGRLVATSDGGSVAIWDAARATEAVRLVPAQSPAASRPGGPAGIVISPDGSTLAAWADSTVRVWDFRVGQELRAMPSVGAVSLPAFSPDGALLAVVGHDETLRLYDRSGTPRAALAADPGYGLDSPAFSPVGTTVAVVRLPVVRPTPDDFRVELWDWRSGATRSWPDVHGRRVVYSPDGRQLALVTISGPAEIRDASSGELIHSLDGHGAAVTDVAYSPDGHLIATAGLDGTARLWDAATGAAVLRLPQVSEAVTSVTFSPDGRELAAGSSRSGRIRVWALDTAELVSIARANVSRTLTQAECREYLHVPRCP